ncbi:MAG: hypothetical protein ACC652_10325 [Acidimicrobiales bacterium]
MISVHEAHEDEIPLRLIAAGSPNANRWVAQHVIYAGRMFELYEVELLNNTQAGEVYSETIALIPGSPSTPPP